MPKFEQIKSQNPSSEVVLLSSDGEQISSHRLDEKKRSFRWQTLDHVSPLFLQRLIQQEDRNFYSHAGIAWPSVLKATLMMPISFFEGRALRGASTLTMQLVKKIFSISSKNIFGKIEQLYLAYRLERVWSKNQILEVYLNIVDFRGELRGVEAASLGLFQKSSSSLNDVESQILVSLLRSPQVSWNTLSHRVCMAMNRSANEDSQVLADQNFCLRLIEKYKPSWQNYSLPTSPQLAPHYFNFVLSHSREKKNYYQSLIQSDLQKMAIDELQTQIRSLKDQNVNDGAILVLDNQSGDVLAYVGSSGAELSQSPAVDFVQAKRQAASTLKPFLYAQAIENNLLEPGSWLEDSPMEIVFANGSYQPTNHDRQFYGWVRAASALSSSLNVPAVRLISELGVDRFWLSLKNLGFGPLQEPDYYGPALALGVVEVSLWQLTNAYRQLAVGQFVSAATSAKIFWMLSQHENRSLSFGIESNLLTSFPSAVKTGTSKDMRDNWCIGYTKKYTVGVWLGNANGAAMWNIMGITGAAPIWQKLITYLESTKPSDSYLNSEEEKRILTRFSDLKRRPQLSLYRITYPTDKTVFAMDPGIPLQNQKIPLQATVLSSSVKQKNIRWFVDEKPVDHLWTPQKGKHKLELWSQDQKQDQIEITVK